MAITGWWNCECMNFDYLVSYRNNLENPVSETISKFTFHFLFRTTMIGSDNKQKKLDLRDN